MDIMTYYDEIAEGYDELHKEEQIKKLQIIKQNLNIKKTDKLLDVGCGTGFSLDYFDCICTGVEPSAAMAAKSSKNVIIARAENLPFEDDYFNIVISVTAIHNFSDIEKGLREMKRVGRDRFAFSVLRKTRHFSRVRKLISNLFKIEKEIVEEKDEVFICTQT
jgi:ubiquinone/menaquinone biosynthesis C-methylase UbiE